MNKKLKTSFFLIIFLFFLYILFYWREYSEDSITSSKIRTIEKDGFCVFLNKEYLNTTSFPCNKLESDILKTLPRDYLFLDYIYKIKNTALSTFHRDVTSSQQVYKTKYPTYTCILYKYSGDLLSICPNSEKTYPFVNSSIINISGNSGTVFLFNCDILHSGMQNRCLYREVIQYKLCHKDDLYLLEHLQGINIEKTEKCEISFYNYSMRKLSYFFELPINTIFYPIMIKRENKDSILGMIQSYIPLSYYNNI
jgi:hypothetical protein